MNISKSLFDFNEGTFIDPLMIISASLKDCAPRQCISLQSQGPTTLSSFAQFPFLLHENSIKHGVFLVKPFLSPELCILFCSQDGTEICRGRLDDFGTILSPAFRAATVFVGIAVIISIITIIAFVLFFMCRYVVTTSAKIMGSSCCCCRRE